jgi:hypothetical protein
MDLLDKIKNKDVDEVVEHLERAEEAYQNLAEGTSTEYYKNRPLLELVSGTAEYLGGDDEALEDVIREEYQEEAEESLDQFKENINL